MGEIMELTSEQLSAQAEQDAKNKQLAIARVNRRESYPSIQDQMDMIWNDMNTGSLEGIGSIFYNTIKDVKEALPKPTE